MKLQPLALQGNTSEAGEGGRRGSLSHSAPEIPSGSCFFTGTYFNNNIDPER